MSRTIRYIFFTCKNNCIVLVSAWGAICIGNMIYLDYLQDVNYKSFELSAADFLLLSWRPFFLCICLIPVFLFCLLSLNVYEFRSNLVIRFKSMKYVWIHQLCRNTIFTAILSVMITGVILYVSCRRASCLVNFEDRFSLFAFMNDGNTMQNPSFISFSVLFCLSLFLYMELAAIAFLLLWWFISQRILAFLAVYLWIMVESYTVKATVLFNRTGMRYDRWEKQEFYILSTILIMLVFMLTGAAIADRKELLYEEK